MWIMLSLVVGLAWPAPADQDDAIRSVKGDETIQQSLPSAPARRTAPSMPPRRERSEQTGSEAGGALASTLLWVLLGAVVLAIVVVIGREVLTRPADGQAGHKADDDAPPLEALKVAAGTLDDAERLAAAGRFGEAIHTLLLQTFESIGRHAALPDSLTSREILRRVRAEDSAIAALRQLVVSVEVCIFGGDQPGAAEYATCRASFEQVLGAQGVEVV